MNYQQALDYINDTRWDSMRFGLERTAELLSRLGSPEKQLKFVHTAGSNGKGSTCAMIESVLRAAGYRTGFYLSPFVEDFRETFRICGEPVSEEDLISVTEEVRDAAEAMEDHPSRFEIETAAGILYFYKKKCDIVILETGMGGTYDSTNVIPAPEAAVITNIGLEHTDFLGNTLSEIAGAKAGIIKSGSVVICYKNTDEVLDVIRKKCTEEGCPLHITDPENEVRLKSRSLDGQVFEWKGLELSCRLLGEHQLKNAAVALTAIEALQERGYRISGRDIQEGFENVEWPVRFEVMSKDPLFIIDCAHNPQCAAALRALIDDYLPGEKITMLTGVLADKDYRQMIGILDDAAAEYVCITPDSGRALPAEELAQILRDMGKKAESFDDIEEAVKKCIDSGRPTVSCTSLYISGQVRKICRTLLQKE